VPHVSIPPQLVDAKATCVQLGMIRSESAQLRNVTWFHGKVNDFASPFDIGLATHLCGEATDMAQALCLRHGAVFVLTPCCLGKIKHVLCEEEGQENSPDIVAKTPPVADTPPVVLTATTVATDGPHDETAATLTLSYPRSRWLQERMTKADYMRLVRLSDFTQQASDAQVASKRLMDTDRLAYAAEAGYDTVASTLWPLEASPKHDVLLGAPARHGLVARMQQWTQR